jgi:multidrug efflux pump subunit AcrA (membrane-fusion protein)
MAALAAACARKEQPQDQANADVGLLVNVAPVVRATLRSEATFPGTTVALRQVTVRSPASGFMSGLTLQPGDLVRRGQLVARIQTREDAAARTGMKMAEQLDPVDSRAMADAVQRYVSGPGIAVTAGENGIVAKRLGSNGQFINEFEPIFELIDAGSMYVEAQAPLRLLGSIHPGQPVTLSSPALKNPLPARVAAILPSASPASQTFPIRVAFQGSTPIAEVGAAVEVSALMAVRPNTAAIPLAAIFVNPESHTDYVFVAGRDGRAHRRTVVIGIRDRKLAEVTSGLREGETVITSGGYALADGLTVRAASR